MSKNVQKKNPEIERRSARWKRSFIRQLCRAVADDLIKKVDNMPTEWDGHELRELLALRFERERGDILYKAQVKRRRMGLNRSYNRTRRKRFDSERINRSLP